MRVGKIVQLSDHNVEGVRVPAASVASALDPQILLARIVAIEKRLTDIAIRVYALENKKPRGAK